MNGLGNGTPYSGLTKDSNPIQAAFTTARQAVKKPNETIDLAMQFANNLTGKSDKQITDSLDYMQGISNLGTEQLQREQPLFEYSKNLSAARQMAIQAPQLQKEIANKAMDLASSQGYNAGNFLNSYLTAFSNTLK